MSEYCNVNFARERVRAGLRWFGPEDEVTIRHIYQTPGITNVITALHDIPPGEAWPEEAVIDRKIAVEFRPHPDEPAGLRGPDRLAWYQAHGRLTGLVWDVAESLIFTEEVKNGDPRREAQVEAYCDSLRILGRHGVNKVVGNFMLVADWTRTGSVRLPDGSLALEYIHDAFVAFDCFILKRHDDLADYIRDGSYSQDEIDAAKKYYQRYLADDPARRHDLTQMITAGLPGAQAGFSLADFRAAVERYRGMTVGQLRANIAYFLDRVTPVARASGVRLCCHSDDPAFTPFLGTPRAVGGIDGYKFLLDHGCGVGLCTGSLMPNEDNRDIVAVIYELAEYGRGLGLSPEEIFPHIHLRPIETDGKNFREGHHACHREELAKVVHALVDIGWQGVFRPDHAPSSDHGLGRPGYDVIGRGYGAQLLLGLFEMGEIIRATRTGNVDAVITACNGDPTRRDHALAAAAQAKRAQIQRVIPHIKMPFVYNRRGDIKLPQYVDDEG